MNRIALEDELVELEQIHNRLDEKIRRGYADYLDDLSLSKLKQEKLSIKRSIETIRKTLGL